MDPALQAVTNNGTAAAGGRKKKKGGGFSLLGKTKTDRTGSRRLIPFGNRKTPTAAAKPAAPVSAVSFNADENRNPENETMDGTETGDSKISGLTDRDGLNAMAAASMARQQQRKKREEPQSSSEASSSGVSLNTPVFREERVMPQMVSSPTGGRKVRSPQNNKYKNMISHRGQPVLQSVPPPPPPSPPREAENPISPSSMATRQMTNKQVNVGTTKNKTTSPRKTTESPRKYKDLGSMTAAANATGDVSVDDTFQQPPSTKKPITYDKVKALLNRVGPSATTNEYSRNNYSTARRNAYSGEDREPSPQMGGDPQEQVPVEKQVRKRLDPGSPTKKVRIATRNDMELNQNRQLMTPHAEEEPEEVGPRGEVDPPTSPMAPARRQVDAPEDCGSPVYSEVAGFTRPPSFSGLVSPLDLGISRSMDAINEFSTNFALDQNGEEEETVNHDQSTVENEEQGSVDPLSSIVGNISRQIKESLDNVVNLDSMPTTECMSPTQSATKQDETETEQQETEILDNADEKKATVSTIAEESSKDVAREALSESKSAEESGAQKRRSRHDLVTNGSIRDKILRKKSLVRATSVDSAERLLRESSPSQAKVSESKTKTNAPLDARTSVSQKASMFAKKYSQTNQITPNQARVIAREALRSSPAKTSANARKTYPDEISLSKYEVVSELDLSTRNFPLKSVETKSVVVSDLDAPLITASASSSSSEFKALRNEGKEQSTPSSTKSSKTKNSGYSLPLAVASSSVVSSETPIDRYKIPSETPLNGSPRKIQPRPESPRSDAVMEDEIQAQSGDQGGVELVYKEKERKEQIPPVPKTRKSKKSKKKNSKSSEKQGIAQKGSTYMKEKLKLRLSRSSSSSCLETNSKGKKSSNANKNGNKKRNHTRSQSLSDEMSLGVDSASLWTDINTTDGESTANQDKSLAKKFPNLSKTEGNPEGPINLVDEPIDLTAYGSFEDLGLDDQAVWLYNISPKASDERELWQPESTDLDSVMDISAAKGPGPSDKYDTVSSPKQESEIKEDDIIEAASSCVGSVHEMLSSPCGDEDTMISPSTKQDSKKDDAAVDERVVVVQGEDVIPVDIDNIIKPKGLVVRPEMDPTEKSTQSPMRSLAHLTVDTEGTGVEAQPHKSASNTARSEKSSTTSVKEQIAEIEKRTTLSPPAPEKFRHQKWKSEHPEHGLPSPEQMQTAFDLQDSTVQLNRPAESMGDEPVDNKTLNSEADAASSAVSNSENGDSSDGIENENNNFPEYYSRPSAYISPVSDTRQSTAVDALDIQLSMSESRNGMETPGTQRSHTLRGFQALPSSFDSDDANGGLRLLSQNELSPLSSYGQRSPRSPRSPRIESFGSDGLTGPGSIDTASASANGTYGGELTAPRERKRMSALQVLGFTPSVEEDLKAACTKVVPGAPLVLGFGQKFSSSKSAKAKSKVLLQQNTKKDLLDIIFEGAESFICGSNSATFEEDARQDLADTIVANESIEVDLEKHQKRDILDCVCTGAEQAICGPPEGNHLINGISQAPKQLTSDSIETEKSPLPKGQQTPSNEDHVDDEASVNSEKFAKFVQEEVSKTIESDTSEIFAESRMIDSTMAVVKEASVASDAEVVESDVATEETTKSGQNGVEPPGISEVDAGEAPEANPSKEVAPQDSVAKPDDQISEKISKFLSEEGEAQEDNNEEALVEPAASPSDAVASPQNAVQDSTEKDIIPNETKAVTMDGMVENEEGQEAEKASDEETDLPSATVALEDIAKPSEGAQTENTMENKENTSEPSSDPQADSENEPKEEVIEDTSLPAAESASDEIEMTASTFEERAAKDVEEILTDPLFDKALEQYFSKNAAAKLEDEEAQDPPADSPTAEELEEEIQKPGPPESTNSELPPKAPQPEVENVNNSGSSDDDIKAKEDVQNDIKVKEDVQKLDEDTNATDSRQGKVSTRGAGHDMIMAIENGFQRLCAIPVPGFTSPRAQKDGPPDCIALPMGSVTNACAERNQLGQVKEDSSYEDYTDEASFDNYKHHQLSDLTLRAMNKPQRYNTEGEDSESLVLSESDVDPVTRPLIQNSTFQKKTNNSYSYSDTSDSYRGGSRNRGANSPVKQSVMEKLRYRRELQSRTDPDTRKKKHLSSGPVDADELFNRYDNIVKQMVVSDHDRLVLAQERKLAESQNQKSPFEEDDEDDDNDGLLGGSLIDNVSSKDTTSTKSQSEQQPPGLVGSLSSSSDQSSTPSEKARDLRRQLDQALKTSASIRTTQERLNTEMSSFKSKLQSQRKAALQEASSFGSHRRRARSSTGVVVGGGAAPYNHPYPEELASSGSNTSHSSSTSSSSSNSDENDQDNVRLQQLDSIIHGLRAAQQQSKNGSNSPASSS